MLTLTARRLPRDVRDVDVRRQAYDFVGGSGSARTDGAVSSAPRPFGSAAVADRVGALVPVQQIDRLLLFVTLWLLDIGVWLDPRPSLAAGREPHLKQRARRPRYQARVFITATRYQAQRGIRVTGHLPAEQLRRLARCAARAPQSAAVGTRTSRWVSLHAARRPRHRARQVEWAGAPATSRDPLRDPGTCSC